MAMTVSASPLSGLYNTTQFIILTASSAAMIYYTIDGSVPTILNYAGSGISPLTAEINTEGTTVLKFFATGNEGDSSVMTETYILDFTTPEVSAHPIGGQYSSVLYVSLHSNDPNANIFYTVDGTNPDCDSTIDGYWDGYQDGYDNSGTFIFVNLLYIHISTMLKFVAKDRAGNCSSIKTETYLIGTVPSGSTPQVDYRINPGLTDRRIYETVRRKNGEFRSPVDDGPLKPRD